MLVTTVYCRHVIHRRGVFSPHLVEIVRKLCIFQPAMRQKIFWRFLEGCGEGRVRVCHSGQGGTDSLVSLLQKPSVYISIL